MAAPTRSLKSEYDSYVEQEIENYKDSIPRSAILRIGDEAVSVIRDSEQILLDEVVICSEVDRIIRKRLRIPTYAAWRRARLKRLALYRRPEHWGMNSETPLVTAVPQGEECHVLLIGSTDEASALYLAANGCQVTAVEEDPDVVERVMFAAGKVGLTSKVNGLVGSVDHWYPAAPLNAVVSSPAAFAHLTADERGRVLEILKSATLDGGVHLVRTLVAGDNAIDLEELHVRYRGWEVQRVDSDHFLARKAVA
jgi:hypothetical protein